MQVAILAGGRGTRLKPITNKVPKSLIAVCGRPFLEYQLDFFKKSGVRDIVLCVGYLGEQIVNHFGNGRKFGVNITYSYDGEQLLGTAGALKNATRLLDGEFFVIYGDSYLFLDFATIMSYFHRFDKLGLMVVYKNYDRYGRSNVVIEDNLVTQYSTKDKTEGMVYIDYGVSVLRKKALELVPQNQHYSLEELLARPIKQKELLAYKVNKGFYQIGSLEGLNEFKRYISQREVLR